MRFITEFECGRYLDNKEYQSFREFKSAQALGVDISKAFGWEKFGSLSLIPGALAKLNYQLEIEAFPMDKWIEFKHKILSMKLYYESDWKVIDSYLKELESFGKPERTKTTE